MEGKFITITYRMWRKPENVFIWFCRDHESQRAVWVVQWFFAAFWRYKKIRHFLQCSQKWQVKIRNTDEFALYLRWSIPTLVITFKGGKMWPLVNINIPLTFSKQNLINLSLLGSDYSRHHIHSLKLAPVTSIKIPRLHLLRSGHISFVVLPNNASERENWDHI